MPALTIFHDAAIVQLQAPFADPSIHANLAFNDKSGGRIVIALTKSAYEALSLAMETFKTREQLDADLVEAAL